MGTTGWFELRSTAICGAYRARSTEWRRVCSAFSRHFGGTAAAYRRERERSSFRELVRSKAVLLLPAFRFARYIAVLGSESTLILKKSILGRLKETLAQSNVL